MKVESNYINHIYTNYRELKIKKTKTLIDTVDTHIQFLSSVKYSYNCTFKLKEI
jgi:hypothetical protein